MSAASSFDLIVRNGTLVIPGVGKIAADIGISGGRIAAIGSELAGPAADVLDASGKVVLPGIFDPHVHIGNELPFEQEAESETLVNKATYRAPRLVALGTAEGLVQGTLYGNTFDSLTSGLRYWHHGH